MLDQSRSSIRWHKQDEFDAQHVFKLLVKRIGRFQVLVNPLAYFISIDRFAGLKIDVEDGAIRCDLLAASPFLVVYTGVMDGTPDQRFIDQPRKASQIDCAASLPRE